MVSSFGLSVKGKKQSGGERKAEQCAQF